MTHHIARESAIRAVKLAVLREPNEEQRAITREALQELLEDLESAEELLDVFYDDVVHKAGELKPDLDRLVFSRRAAKAGQR